MSTIELVLPSTPPSEHGAVPSAIRPGRSTPLRIVLIDNNKPRAREILTMLGEALGELLPVAHTRLHRKVSASAVLSAAEAEALAGDHDIAITGLGDCGGCSAGSMQDALALERAGLPATVVVTEPFVTLVTELARQRGAPDGRPILVLPHPVATKDDAALRRLVAAVAPRAVAQLTASGAHTDAVAAQS